MAASANRVCVANASVSLFGTFPLARKRPERICLELSPTGVAVSSSADCGKVSGVFHREFFTRRLFSVLEVDGVVCFADVESGLVTRIDSEDVSVLIERRGPFRRFVIRKDGVVQFEKRYFSLLADVRNTFFDDLEGVDVDFFRSTCTEKSGGFVNFRHYLGVLRRREAGTQAG